MMYDALAYERQRQQQADIRRRVACSPQPTAGPKLPREAHRHRGLRRLSTASSSC